MAKIVSFSPNPGFLVQLEIFHKASYKISRKYKYTRLFYMERTTEDVMSTYFCVEIFSFFSFVSSLQMVTAQDQTLTCSQGFLGHLPTPLLPHPIQHLAVVDLLAPATAHNQRSASGRGSRSRQQQEAAPQCGPCYFVCCYRGNTARPPYPVSHHCRWIEGY